MAIRSAVFLGAGASRAFGFPLTTELLPMMLGLLDTGTLFHTYATTPPQQVDADQLILRRRLEAFLPGLRQTWQTLRSNDAESVPTLSVSITDVLSLVDHAIASGAVRAGMSNEELQEFRRTLERALCSVLWHAEGPADRDNAARSTFIDWLLELRAQGSLSLMTTNYDLVVEQPLFARLGGDPSTPWVARHRHVAETVDFGFPWRDPGSGEIVARPPNATLQLLKLHGSLNSLRCPLCGQTYLNVFGYIAHEGFRSELNSYNTCHCADWARLRVNLVTPSLVRQIQDAGLLGVWQTALESLRTAERWFLIGYSLPAEDIAIRSLLVRAWEGRSAKPEVVVIQHGQAARQIHDLILPGCEYFPGGLAAYLEARR